MALGTMKHNAAKMDDTPAGFPPIITAITAITAAIANCRKTTRLMPDLFVSKIRRVPSGKQKHSRQKESFCNLIQVKRPNYTCVTNLRSMKFCLQNMQIFSYLGVPEKVFSY